MNLIEVKANEAPVIINMDTVSRMSVTKSTVQGERLLKVVFKDGSKGEYSTKSATTNALFNRCISTKNDKKSEVVVEAE